MQNRVSKNIFLTLYNDSGCVDTDSWENGHGENCISYANRFCQNNGANLGSEWALGSTYNYPENNCCVCGKGKLRGKRNLFPIL